MPRRTTGALEAIHLWKLPLTCTCGWAREVGWGRPRGGDAGLDRVRYRYRLLIYIFALEQEGVM
jgi:hypothetical protein